MSAIVECVGNFSEGRRDDAVRNIVNAIAAIDGVSVLGGESDIDHNRSVVTFAGSPAAVSEAAFAGIREAAIRIDMQRHRGQHPRIGAADVIPFVPFRDVTMAECVRLARSLGARVGEELQLPVFLYEQAALQDANKNLADIRRGGYERLRQTITAGQLPQPDFGPRMLGRAGGCAIGARRILIAFNVLLSTSDVEIAHKIARKIRQSSGGFPHVKALGFSVKGKAQVSMNLTNYQVTPLPLVVDKIRQEARCHGAEIKSSEIIGLIPQDALAETDLAGLKIENYGPERILEVMLNTLL